MRKKEREKKKKLCGPLIIASLLDRVIFPGSRRTLLFFRIRMQSLLSGMSHEGRDRGWKKDVKSRIPSHAICTRSSHRDMWPLRFASLKKKEKEKKNTYSTYSIFRN